MKIKDREEFEDAQAMARMQLIAQTKAFLPKRSGTQQCRL